MEEKKPSALATRQLIQKAMTVTRETISPTKFNSNQFDVINISVEIKNLDPIFHNYKIANLSDLHLGQWLTPEYLNGVIKLVNEREPNMITLTGDYISYILDDFAEDLENCLKELKPKDISVAVLGNHDHWLGADKIRKILKNAGIKDLSNDVFTLEKKYKDFKNNNLENNANKENTTEIFNYEQDIINKKNSKEKEAKENIKNSNKKDYKEIIAKLHIAGVDSLMVGKDSLETVMKKLPQENPAILLAHEPDFAEISATTGRFALQISGHSHGGQFIIPGIETTLFRGSHSHKYPVGKYKVKDMMQYTSRGLGTNVFWLRVNCKPEITIFTLKSSKIMNKKEENRFLNTVDKKEQLKNIAKTLPEEIRNIAKLN